MRVFVLGLAVATTLSCSRKPDTTWGTERTDPEAAYKLTVFGSQSSGIPYVAVMAKYRPGGLETPKFVWSHTTGFDASDVNVDGNPVPYEGSFILIVNDSAGNPRRVTVSPDRVEAFKWRQDFRWDKAMFEKFWTDVVQPQLGS